MSLYNLAADLFADIDRVRVAAPKPRSDTRTHMRSADNEQENTRIVNDVKLPLLVRSSPWDGHTPQTPTLELLEGCLRDIHKIRCGSRAASVAKTKHRRFNESVGDLTSFVDGQDLVPSSSSETPCTAGELSSQKIYATAGSDTAGPGTGMSDRKNHETQFEGKIVPPSLMLTSGGYAAKAETSAMSTSTSADESRASRNSLNHPYPRLLQNGECLATGRGGAVCSDTDIDTVAKESFMEFEREIEDWSVSAGTNVSRRARMNIAAHLSAKYLCGVLDPMPSSARVRHLRREVSHRIDQLATGEGLLIEESGKGVLCGVGERTPPCEHGSDVNGDDGRHESLKHRSRDHVTSSLVKTRATVGLEGPRTLSPRHGRLTGSLGAAEEGGVPARCEVKLKDVGQTLPDMTRKNIGGDSKTISSSTSRTNSSSSSSSSKRRRSRSSSREISCNSPAVADNPSGSERCIATTATGYAEGNTGVAQAFVDQAAQSTPVRETKACSFSSSRSAEGSRARVVRFLLNEDNGDDQSVPIGGEGGSRTQAKNAEPEAPKPVDVDSLWLCFVCDRRNEPGRGVCAICGRRRQDHGRALTEYSNEHVERHSSGADWGRGGSKGRPARRRGGAHQESVDEAAGSGGQTLAVRGGGSGGPVATVARNNNRGVGRYDMSSFAKMKEMTEPAVKARLSLTGEIKSLLSAIRGGS